MKINPEELLALIAGAEAKGAMEQRFRDAMGIESTTFAPPFVRPEPNANLPSSLATLQNGPTVRMGVKEFDDHPKPRIDVTDGQVYATADLDGVDVPDGLYDGWDRFYGNDRSINMRIVDRQWKWEPLIDGKTRTEELGCWKYLRYVGPLDESAPTPPELPTEETVGTLSIDVHDGPQGLPSAEELAEFLQGKLNAQNSKWWKLEDFDSEEQQQLITTMQEVIDKVLQALPQGELVRLLNQQVENGAEHNRALEAKVRELEEKMGDYDYALDLAENATKRETLRAEKAEAQLAALGTPIDPISDVQIGDKVGIYFVGEVRGVFRVKHPRPVSIFDGSSIVRPDKPIVFKLNTNAPTE